MKIASLTLPLRRRKPYPQQRRMLLRPQRIPLAHRPLRPRPPQRALPRQRRLEVHVDQDFGLAHAVEPRDDVVGEQVGVADAAEGGGGVEHDVEGELEGARVLGADDAGEGG